MSVDAKDVSCLHAPTPEEKQRDADYRGCDAKSGEPCTWARRYDGVVDPPYHSERIELAATHTVFLADAMSKEAFDQAVLDDGEV